MRVGLYQNIMDIIRVAIRVKLAHVIDAHRVLIVPMLLSGMYCWELYWTSGQITGNINELIVDNLTPQSESLLRLMNPLIPQLLPMSL
jgi:hypothetical protein